MNISRRHLLKSSLAGITASMFTQQVMSALNNKRTRDTFQHGVASGEPCADGVLLWTRISQNNETTPTVTWQLAADSEFKEILQSGQQTTSAEQDFSIKVTVKQLQAGTQYFYRFQYQDIMSEPGRTRTRTLPTGELNKLCLAVASCSNFPFGYFNAYEVMAADQDIDFVLHLGDYIYEYGADGYGGKTGKAINRDHRPSHEIISLADYRQRHAQYKADTASRLLHASHPIIAIWDDHESANNPYMAGAQNHQADEGPWAKRRAASLQAYYEWMPIHTPDIKLESLWRSFEFGNLASLVTLETRHTGRSKQIDYSDHLEAIKKTEDRDYFLQKVLGEPSRTMLSPEMESFYQQETQRSLSTGKHWRLLGNQIPMARTHVPDMREVRGKNSDGGYDPVAQEHAQFHQLGEFNLPLYLDTWDGYPAAREAFYKINKDLGVQDLLVLTGDSHSFWANQLFDAAGQAMGLELGTAGITSPGDFEDYGADTATLMDKLITQHNPEVNWTDCQHRGFIKLSIKPDLAKAEFISVDNILTEQYQVNKVKTLIIDKRDKTLNYR